MLEARHYCTLQQDVVNIRCGWVLYCIYVLYYIGTNFIIYTIVYLYMHMHMPDLQGPLWSAVRTACWLG